MQDTKIIPIFSTKTLMRKVDKVDPTLLLKYVSEANQADFNDTELFNYLMTKTGIKFTPKEIKEIRDFMNSVGYFDDRLVRHLEIQIVKDHFQTYDNYKFILRELNKSVLYMSLIPEKERTLSELHLMLKYADMIDRYNINLQALNLSTPHIAKIRELMTNKILSMRKQESIKESMSKDNSNNNNVTNTKQDNGAEFKTGSAGTGINDLDRIGEESNSKQQYDFSELSKVFGNELQDTNRNVEREDREGKTNTIIQSGSDRDEGTDKGIQTDTITSDMGRIPNRNKSVISDESDTDTNDSSNSTGNDRVTQRVF